MSAPQHSIRLFRFLGITVYLHWLWFAVAAYQLDRRADLYPSPIWSAAEYLGLFLLVLMHEYGHALACRSTGGEARQILLWPLGGIAYVAPPNRPGAVLWSIAAGPLVNVALLPVFWLAKQAALSAGWLVTIPSAVQLLETLSIINLVLLIFNLLPIFPLDGGQILRALLWFPLGAVKSLVIASGIGMFGAVALVALAVVMRDFWLGLIAFFALSQSWAGFQQARLIAKMERQAREAREGSLF
ncbi:MAG TPA: site-2 protease family protein [Chthoniobacteraceae bacterium]|nr:site-2 protease family protein [Chthoniobacteraceae bacterium]